MRNRYIRLGVSLVAALVISFLLVGSVGGKQTIEYRPVVVAAQDIEVNTILTSDNLTVKSLPAQAYPKGRWRLPGR